MTTLARIFALVVVIGLFVVTVSNRDPKPTDPTLQAAPIESAETTSTAKVDYADRSKQAGWIGKSEEAIRYKLKDPSSAQFRNAAFFSGSGRPLVCGEVNSKNSFGGYGGFERFIAAGDVLTVIESEMADGEMDKSWQLLCK